MGLFEKKSAIKIVEGELEYLKLKYNSAIFDVLIARIMRVLNKNAHEFEQKVKAGRFNARHYTYSALANLTGDMAESGQYHIYRGVLDDQGQTLLQIFNDSTDYLIENNEITKEFGERQKQQVLINIRSVG